MYVCMDGWMDGWMDGGMDTCMHEYIHIYICLCRKHNNQLGGLSCFFGPATEMVNQKIITKTNSYLNYLVLFSINTTATSK